MAVKWREKRGKEGGKEGVRWRRGNENKSAGEARETDREHKGGREMVSARRSKGLTREQ